MKWTANLDSVKEQLVAEQLRFSPRLRQTYAELADIRWLQLDHFYTELADIEPELGLNRVAVGGPARVELVNRRHPA